MSKKYMHAHQLAVTSFVCLLTDMYEKLSTMVSSVRIDRWMKEKKQISLFTHAHMQSAKAKICQYPDQKVSLYTQAVNLSSVYSYLAVYC